MIFDQTTTAMDDYVWVLCRLFCFVLLSFIFLLFREDFLHGYELSHDILCTSRSDDNRRAAGAVNIFSIQNSFYSNKSFSGLTARRWGILFVPCIQWTTKKIRVHLCSFVVPNEYLILNYWQTNLWNWFLRASLEEFNGASRRPPFASNRDESAMSTAGRHFKIQIRIPSCLFGWIAFACQKWIVLWRDHEQWNF